MQKILLACLTSLLALGSVASAEPLSKKDYEKRYAAFSGHKKFFKNEKWAMVKFHVVYKLTTAKVTKAMDKEEFRKVKSSSGAYGILKGVTEDDLQQITNQVAERFISRMRDEAGIEILTWSTFADSPNTKKLMKKAQGNEVYSKSQGLGYIVAYDGTPIWNQVIAIVPGGKKLGKELGAHNGMLTMYVDFADTFAEASAWIDKKTIGKSSTYDAVLKGWWVQEHVQWNWGESHEERIVPVVRIRPDLGSQSSWEQATNLGRTSVGGQAYNYYNWSMTLTGAHPDALVSDLSYATSVNAFEGQLPEVLQNRSNKKLNIRRPSKSRPHQNSTAPR